jgi:ribose 5-phosphate isomerase B
MKIVVGSDPWGFELKNAVKEHLEQGGHEVIDVGGATAEDDVPYWETASAACKRIQEGEAERGILFCGTGMGMAIVANKLKGIFASVIESAATAKLCRAVNNSNVLTMGGLLVTPFVATQAVDNFLTTKLSDGLEEHAEFLKKAIKEVGAIDEANAATNVDSMP